VAWSQGGGASFLGGSMAQPLDFSSETADEIDREVKTLVERAYRRAKDLLQTNLDVLHRVAAAQLVVAGVLGTRRHNPLFSRPLPHNTTPLPSLLFVDLDARRRPPAPSNSVAARLARAREAKRSSFFVSRTSLHPPKRPDQLSFAAGRQKRSTTS